MDRVVAGDRRMRDMDNAMPLSAGSSRLNQRRDVESPSARKPFNKAENLEGSGMGGSRLYSGVDGKQTPRTATKLNEDYHNRYDPKEQLESGSGRRLIQNSTTKHGVSGTLARSGQQGDTKLAGNYSKHTGDLVVSGSRNIEGSGHSAGARESSSSSLLKMKEDLLRDQAKLDHQLRTNAARSDERSTENIARRYDRDRSALNVSTAERSQYRSSYAAQDHLVRL